MIMLSGSVCWPRDLLKVDAPGCRIFTWGYDSSVANVTQAASQATIFGHSESLLQDICMSRTDQDEVERPLVFVGHSLGGLVIKEALIRSSEYHFNEQDEDLGSVYACTKGVVFLGTPHRGSELTPYGHIVAKVAKLLLRQPNERLISLLENESPILERQRRSFASISKDMGLACVIEELATPLGIVSHPTALYKLASKLLYLLSQGACFWNTLFLEQPLSRTPHNTTNFNCPQLRQLRSYDNIVFNIRIT